MTLQQRYEEFLRQARLIAQDLGIEVEFTTQEVGHGYYREYGPFVEVIPAADADYVDYEGGCYYCAPGATEIK